MIAIRLEAESTGFGHAGQTSPAITSRMGHEKVAT